MDLATAFLHAPPKSEFTWTTLGPERGDMANQRVTHATAYNLRQWSTGDSWPPSSRGTDGADQQ